MIFTQRLDPNIQYPAEDGLGLGELRPPLQAVREGHRCLDCHGVSLPEPLQPDGDGVAQAGLGLHELALRNEGMCEVSAAGSCFRMVIPDG